MNLTEILIAAILSFAIFGVSYAFYAESREETNMERTCENLTAFAGNIRVHSSEDLPGLLAMDIEGLRKAEIIPAWFLDEKQAGADIPALKTPFGAVTLGTGNDGESSYWTVNLAGLNGKDCYRILRTARTKNLWDGAGTTADAVVKTEDLTDTKLIEMCGKKGYDGSALMAIRNGKYVAMPTMKKDALSIINFGADGRNADHPIIWKSTAADMLYGKAVLGNDGIWTYTPDSTNAGIKALEAGESLVEKIYYTAYDGDGDGVKVTLKLTITKKDDGSFSLANKYSGGWS